MYLKNKKQKNKLESTFFLIATGELTLSPNTRLLNQVN